jgi:hypothetical protein
VQFLKLTLILGAIHSGLVGTDIKSDLKVADSHDILTRGIIAFGAGAGIASVYLWRRQGKEVARLVQRLAALESKMDSAAPHLSGIHSAHQLSQFIGIRLKIGALENELKLVIRGVNALQKPSLQSRLDSEKFSGLFNLYAPRMKLLDERLTKLEQRLAPAGLKHDSENLKRRVKAVEGD